MTYLGIFLGAIFFFISYLTSYNFLASYKLAIGIVIAQVPECLMTTGILALGLAIHKLKKKNCLIKKMSVIEKIGNISTICSDKTGTLTQNSMNVKYMWYNDTMRNIDTPQAQSEIALERYLVSEKHPLLYDALLCNSVTFLGSRKKPTIKKDW